jgi:NAD/NADP transhydrogenase beta subunit
VSVIGLLVDPRTVMGAPSWAKPLKFSISFGLYTLTLAWLMGMLQSYRRLAWWAGTVTGVFLMVEIVIISGAVVAGGTSHFNFTAPLNAALYQVMGVSIVIAWIAALPVILVLFRTDLGDPARTVAIRAGFAIGLIGMGLAVLMTLPTPDQTSNYQGVIGAHTVGVPDGGPGLPLLGWSTVAGDLRIPHFVGMHALQLIPLAAVTLELLASRVPALRNARVRRNVIWIVVTLFVSILAVLTSQALGGQSIVRPSGIVLTVSALLYLGAASAVTIVILRHTTTAGSPTPFPRVDA